MAWTNAEIDRLQSRVIELTAALRLHDDYMQAQFREGPDSSALHPKAAENWKRIRAVLNPSEQSVETV